MAAPSYTYTLVNGTTADASQVMQNFSDVLNGITDGTKDLSISALTCAGTTTLNGHVNVGNSSADDLSITASLASSIAIKTTNTYNIGSSTLGLASAYFGANSQTVRLLPSASMSATWTLTLPVTAGTANYLLTTNGSGVSAWSSWTTAAWYADGSNAGTLSATTQTIGGAKTFSGLTTMLSGAFTGGSTADFTIWQGTNNLLLRGGSAGISFRNTSDAVMVTVTNNGISGYNAGTMTAVGVTSGNVLGDVVASRREWKKDLEPLDISGIWTLPTYKFRWKSTEEADTGCIADETDKLMPDFTVYDKDGSPRGVQYHKLAVACIAALQQLKGEFDAYKAAHA